MFGPCLWSGPSPTSVPSSILLHPAVCPQQTWVESSGRRALPQLGPHLALNGLGEAYLHDTKWRLHPSSRLATVDMGRKVWVLCSFGKEGWAPSNTMSPRPRYTSLPSGSLIHPAVWPQQTWAKNWRELCTFREGELGLHLAQCGLCRGLSPCQVLS